jgi:uncharacterized protein YacL
LSRPNWDHILLRAGFVVLAALLAGLSRPFGLSAEAAAIASAVAAIIVNLIELRIRRAALSSLLGACAGTLLGGLCGVLFVVLLSPVASWGVNTTQFLRLTVPLFCGFIGLLVGVAKSNLLDLSAFGLFADSAKAESVQTLLDTSVLIDGRIADIAESGFLDGVLVIPQFVLHELQLVADSAESAKRNRGRRGLDIVQRLQKMPNVEVQVSSSDYPSVREVDLKLIEMAKAERAKIMTNDFNLNKLAQVQGVEVLNINELANALKPVVLPGEMMRVFILKEGKEYNQGVAYLDDGTMVVVDNARRLISKTVDVTVTSVLQTTAGKMIFGKYDERAQSSPAERATASATSASAASG